MPRQKVDITREHALKALHRTETKLSFPKLIIGRAEAATLLEKRQKAFTYELVMGTLRRRGTLDRVLADLCKDPIENLTPWIRNILRMGAYQILYLDAVPKSAAVDESVKLAKKYGHSGTAGLVNAVLRNVNRDRLKSLLDSLDDDDPADLAVKHSHPEWIVGLLIEEYGREAVVAIMNGSNAIPPLTARVNTLRTTRDALLQRLEEDGISASPLPRLEEAVRLEGVTSPARLEAHKEGHIYFQDASSMLAARLLGARPGEKILDVCAGPGGKSTHLAALMKNEGDIFALDLHKHRVELIKENADRLGANKIVRAEMADATEDLADKYGEMDRVLVDAPCSGLGVIRRRIDLKWRLRPEQIDELARLQLKILEKAAACVKRGGILLYCTCTITRRENSEIVEAFIEAHTDFKVDATFPEGIQEYATKQGFLRILPGEDDMDGFFIARLRRL